MSVGSKAILVLIFVTGTNLSAQHLSQQVLVPAAGVVSSGNIYYSQTIGETATEIINNFDFVLTQGFQQPGIKISDEPVNLGTGVNVYPNPVTDYIKIKLFGDIPRKFTIELISITGTIIKTATLEFYYNYNYIQQMETNDLKRGLYFVRVTSSDKMIQRTFKIQKM